MWKEVKLSKHSAESLSRPVYKKGWAGGTARQSFRGFTSSHKIFKDSHLVAHSLSEDSQIESQSVQRQYLSLRWCLTCPSLKWNWFQLFWGGLRYKSVNKIYKKQEQELSLQRARMQPRVEVETWERQYESPGSSSGWSTPIEGRETSSRLLQWAIQVR